MEPIITAEKLTHIYSVGTPFEHVAIRDVDFEAYRGECLGIIGHTGSGKSTFIQHLNGLIKPTSGKITFDGHDLYESKEFTKNARFRIGLVFQYPEYQLFEETVYKDISFGPKNMKLSQSEIDERVREAADVVGLDGDMLEKSPFDLSGGQKRRAAIAGVLAMRPEVLILDEPTAGLDPAGREDIIANIQKYRRARNATVIMVTHSMEEIARSVDRLYVFNRAQIAMSGTPREVFSHREELGQMGLSVPRISQVAGRLREMGLDLPEGILTVDELVKALTDRKGGDVRA